MSNASSEPSFTAARIVFRSAAASSRAALASARCLWPDSNRRAPALPLLCSVYFLCRVAPSRFLPLWGSRWVKLRFQWLALVAVPTDECVRKSLEQFPAFDERSVRHCLRTHSTLAGAMYPITPTEVHAGHLAGKGSVQEQLGALDIKVSWVIY